MRVLSHLVLFLRRNPRLELKTIAHCNHNKVLAGNLLARMLKLCCSIRTSLFYIHSIMVDFSFRPPCLFFPLTSGETCVQIGTEVEKSDYSHFLSDFGCALIVEKCVKASQSSYFILYIWFISYSRAIQIF